jgi:hypothetical protein
VFKVDDTGLEDIRHNLLEKGLEENVEEKNGHVKYSGSRFSFIFWEKSAIFRDHYRKKANKDDLYAWKEFADQVEEDLKYPPE